MPQAVDRRNLANLRMTASTTRVLDLALIEEKFGDTDDFKSNPLFSNAKLNRSMILKHTLRLNERGIFNNMRMNATKILFAFIANDLSAGAEFLFVNEPDFPRKLAAKLGVKNLLELQEDLDLLNVIDGLPSFDPFLMRERLRQFGKEPARCYFEVSVADTARMQAFVTTQIAALVALAFANQGRGAKEMSSRLAEKLMTDETAESLEPLRATLRLSGDEYREGVFAWKGFLYYKWSVEEWGARLPDLARSILSSRILNTSRQELETLGNSRQRIIKIIGSTNRRVLSALAEYDAAFKALSEGKPTAFRDFLIRAPSMFLSIGEAVGVIKHIDSFWRFRFPAGRTPTMEGAEALDIFQDFEMTLSGIETSQEQMPQSWSVA